MLKGLEIVFHGIDQSDAVEKIIKKKVHKLESYSDKIKSCRVVVDKPHNHHNKGTIYHVSLDVTLPDSNISIHNDQHDKHSHEDVYVAIRDAFDVAKRKLLNRPVKSYNKLTH